MNIMLELIILTISAVANLVLALLVFANNPRGIVNRYFILFVASFIGWTIINYVSVHPIFLPQLFLVRLALAAATFLSMYLLLLVNVLPNGVSTYRKLNRYVIIIGILIAVVTLTPFVFSRLQYSQTGVSPVVGVAIPFFGLYAVGGLILAIVLLFFKYKRFSGLLKQQTRLVLMSISVSFSLIIVSNFIMVAFFGNTSLIAFAPLYSLIFTTSFTYIILKHHLFDIRLLIARFLAYLLLLLVVAGLYGFITVVVSYLLTGIQPNMTQTLVSTAIVSILILFVEPLRLFFNSVTRAIFYQDAYEIKDILDKLASVLVRSINTDLLVNNSIAILKEALKFEQMTILLLDETQKDGQRLVNTGKDMSEQVADFSMKVLEKSPSLVMVDASEGQSSRILTKMKHANIAVIARLETQGGSVGYCFFGYKTSGSVYTQRDVDLIRIACDELAVAIQNALRFEQIQDFNKTLQQRIEGATKELRASNAQLQRLDEAKDEFVSMASHQLRTPLTSVKGYISMVLEGDAGKITTMQQQLLGEAFTSSERMVHLISDFLNVSRLQTGKFVIEARPADLAKVVTQEVEGLQTTANARNLKLQFRRPSVFPILYIDENKIRQVIMNFIDNAIYYSPQGTTIHVELAIIEGSAVLRVRDTGIGVPKAEQAHLFTKFYRASNARKQRPDGTGIGLFLAKKVIVAHGGTMLFESTEGQGSTFGFRLPVKLLSSPARENVHKLK